MYYSTCYVCGFHNSVITYMGKKVGHEKQLRNTYIILLQFKKSCYLTFKYTEVVLCSFNTTYTSNKYKVHADTKCCAKLAL